MFTPSLNPKTLRPKFPYSFRQYPLNALLHLVTPSLPEIIYPQTYQICRTDYLYVPVFLHYIFHPIPPLNPNFPIQYIPKSPQIFDSKTNSSTDF